METPNVPEILALLRGAAASRTAADARSSYYLGRERLIPTGTSRMARWRKKLFVFMSRNAQSARRSSSGSRRTAWWSWGRRSSSRRAFDVLRAMRHAYKPRNEPSATLRAFARLDVSRTQRPFPAPFPHPRPTHARSASFPSRAVRRRPLPSSTRSFATTAQFSFYDRGPTARGAAAGSGARLRHRGDEHAVRGAGARAARDRRRGEGSGARRGVRVELRAAHDARVHRVVAGEHRAARRDPRRSRPARRSARDERRRARAARRAHAGRRVPLASVHGNESPGFETAIQTLYQLAASDEPATVSALRNTIVVINPSSNPDGHERFTVWYNSINVRHPDPNAIEHDEPWSVQGRFNHYRFDMNRDVMASTQREVQGLMRAMLRWHPMVAADLHGAHERLFLSAGRESRSTRTSATSSRSGWRSSAAPTPPRSTGTAGCTTRATSSTSTPCSTGTRGRRSSAPPA